MADLKLSRTMLEGLRGLVRPLQGFNGEDWVQQWCGRRHWKALERRGLVELSEREYQPKPQMRLHVRLTPEGRRALGNGGPPLDTPGR